MALSGIIKNISDAVNGSQTDITNYPVIPEGEIYVIKKFGGYAENGVMSIQWGKSGAWETIRAASGSFDYDMDNEFVGDGEKLVRIIRQNKSITSSTIVVWVEGYKRT